MKDETELLTVEKLVEETLKESKAARNSDMFLYVKIGGCMEILIDSREKQKAIKNIIATFDQNGVKYASSKLFVGDYQNIDNPRLVIDRKQNLNELCSNVCQQHARFKAELLRAVEFKIRLVFLVEHGKGITTLDDVKKWQNPRKKTSPNATDGERLYKILKTIEERYDTKFVFCEKKNTGEEILRILRG